MSEGRGQGGPRGIAGAVNVALEKEGSGENTPLPADDEGLLIAKVFGEDNDGNDNPLSTDSKGRLTVKQRSDLFESSDFTEDRNVRELQNETGVVSGQDTGGGSLPSNSVPDGRTVRVQALQGNGATVEVDGNFELVPGQAVDLGVDNTDKISYTANAGDGVCFIVES